MAILNTALSHFLAHVHLLLPEFLLVAGMVLILVCSWFTQKTAWFSGISLATILATAVAVFQTKNATNLGWNMLEITSSSLYLKEICLIAAFGTLVFQQLFSSEGTTPPEFYLLLLGILLGAHFMVMATHLLMLFLAIEMVSLEAYLLAGFRKNDRFAAEAGVKYLLFGAFSSALMLYGLSWLYGSTGSLVWNESFWLQFQCLPILTQTVILLLFLSGFWFKISIVPFHFWTPEIYEGVNYPTATFFSIVPKIAGIGALMNFMGMEAACGTCALPIRYVLAFLAVLTLTVGNLGAMTQKTAKRLLAFSAIAHSGFLLLLLLPQNPNSFASTLFYLGVYSSMNFLAFFICGVFSIIIKRDKLSHFSGLASQYPLLTVCVTIAMAALIGLPPTAGFIAKWYGFMAIWQAWTAQQDFVWLFILVAALLNTVVALYYYLRIPTLLVFGKSEIPQQPLPQKWVVHSIALGLTFILLLLGIWGFDTSWEWLYNAVK